jgi:hypothetical protein
MQNLYQIDSDLWEERKRNIILFNRFHRLEANNNA